MNTNPPYRRPLLFSYIGFTLGIISMGFVVMAYWTNKDTSKLYPIVLPTLITYMSWMQIQRMKGKA